MVKISKYTKENLLRYIKCLNQKVYLFFYDLECENFDDVICKLSNYLDIKETKIVKYQKRSCLAIFSCLKHQKIQYLIDEMNSMDIAEFDISEYQESQEFIKSICQNIGKVENSNKSIYVNKDEGVMQLYNFSQ